MLRVLAALPLVALFVCVPAASAAGSDPYASALEKAGANRAQIERAVAETPADQQWAQRWLVAHMPTEDLRTLDAAFLVENCTEAFAAWRAAPWKDAVGEELFLDNLLPYANVNERRDAWRVQLRRRFLPLVEKARTSGEAATMLNNAIWAQTGVKYSTKRKKADQSPFETMESGLASCSGLSILLVDACRAVGVPARFVGTALWSDKSGNHSWVEVWDGKWRYTGAAEPTGDRLDEGWFGDRAAGAKQGDPLMAIWAVTWRDSPATFPLVWLPDDRTYRALDVTARYTTRSAPVPEGKVRVRFRVTDGKARVEARIEVKDAQGALVFQGASKDERYDANDHLTAVVERGAQLVVYVDGAQAKELAAGSDELLVDLERPATRSASPRLAWLQRVLADGGPLVHADPERDAPLTKEECAAALELLVRRDREAHAAEARRIVDGRRLERDGLAMKFWWTAYGEKPATGRSLWISMHGGGGAPPEVNEQQWENQKRLYKLEEGIYLAPRAPTDTWNLWHQGHIDGFFEDIVEAFVRAEGVDPDRVHILGYSAGGDGVYQLAPRMADRFAAAGMMAGHPNETRPDGLRNIAFALHMGANDGAYDRNKIAAQWQTRLDELAQADPGGYVHLVVLHAGKGHWMDRQDAVALPWMAQHVRDPHPKKIVWLQDDVVHKRYYWLEAASPKAGERIVAERDGQAIRVTGAEQAGDLVVHLSDEFVDLDAEVRIERDGRPVWSGVPRRTLLQLAANLEEFADPRRAYSASVRVPAAR